ncbi:hypothetical protein Fbal_3100 [Ferrimonas balearica DSM 9799]|uniref:Uncharacterized protein n=1 Tax=Ferrimonas balearica (strain DSM 9799 / CCM 4581 / KCTC 23876 / PAT) TaxID=550540 RepID=E1SUJ2_FERBD|nr:hypothetical protein Fbal_3100 [Ferrimonas balearica DSM 9799]
MWIHLTISLSGMAIPRYAPGQSDSTKLVFP